MLKSFGISVAGAARAMSDLGRAMKRLDQVLPGQPAFPAGGMNGIEQLGPGRNPDPPPITNRPPPPSSPPDMPASGMIRTEGDDQLAPFGRGQEQPQDLGENPPDIVTRPVRSELEGIRNGILSVNEARRSQGLDPLPEPGGSMALMDTSRSINSWSTSSPGWGRQPEGPSREQIRDEVRREMQEKEKLKRSEDSARRKLLRPEKGRRIIVRKEQE